MFFEVVIVRGRSLKRICHVIFILRRLYGITLLSRSSVKFYARYSKIFDMTGTAHFAWGGTYDCMGYERILYLMREWNSMVLTIKCLLEALITS